MKPPKNVYPIFAWMMRLTFLLLAYILFWDKLKEFEFHTFTFWISFLFVALSVTLFIGGFSRSHDLTLISSLGLGIIALYHCYISFTFPLTISFVLNLLIASSAFVLFSLGNK
ncbi:MAG: hypothetical protein N2Z72_01385 [Bacteroidales bacterium]|nr:hypothetical protein [Bacteroidales bacterium]